MRARDRVPYQPANNGDVEMVPDSEEERDATMIEDRGEQGDEGDEVRSEAGAADGPMKTMAELAAEHAERQRQLGLSSTRGSELSRPSVRSSRARRKAANKGSDDEPEMDENGDSLESSLSDCPPNSSPPSERRVTPLKASSRKGTRSPSKPALNLRKKRARSPDVDGGSDMESDVPSASKATGSRPRRTTTGGRKLEPRTSRTVSGPSSTSIAVPASDRVLRSRKGKT